MRRSESVSWMQDLTNQKLAMAQAAWLLCAIAALLVLTLAIPLAGAIFWQRRDKEAVLISDG